MDLVTDEIVFKSFFEHLNASLCVLDFIRKTAQLKDGFDPFANDPFLVTIDPALQELVNATRYQEFILAVVRHIAIPPVCTDIFRSELDEGLLNVFIAALAAQTQKVTIAPHPNGFCLQCPALISDLIIPVVSRLHTEVMMTFKQFDEWMRAFEGKQGSLFLQAKSSNRVSQFLQMWVADEVGLPQAPFTNGTVVL